MPSSASERRLRLPVIAFGVAAAAVALVAALTFTRAWETFEWKVFDLFTTVSAPGVNTQPIVLLAIDEPTFQQLQVQWPFPRSLHGRLLERVRADGALAVGFDFVFAEPSADPAEDARFAASIRRAGKVVLASSQERIENANASLWTQVAPIEPLLEAGGVAGDISVQPERDYVIRRQATADDSFSAQLAALSGLPVARRDGPPPTLIQYLGPRGTIDTRSYYQAIEPGLLPPGFFRGKVVLVGRSSRSAVELQSGRADMFNTPFTGQGEDPLFPGVEVQATMLENRLGGGGLRAVDGGWGHGIVIVLGALLLLAGRRLHPATTAGLALGSALLVLGTSYTLFNWRHLWLPPVFPVAALVAVYGSTTLVGLVAVRRRARQVRGVFAQYVAPQVVARLVRDPSALHLGGETRTVTLLFTDLADFTAHSERLSAQQTVELLNAYFDAMTPIVQRYEGTIDKYIGDAIMAFWGAPLDDARHAEHALRAALEMQAAMAPLNEHLRNRGLPPIAMRIGLNTGPAVIGNVGSEIRKSYTAIGDTVNLAARLEGANKAFGTGILLSEATAAQLPAAIRLRHLDDVIVKGRSEPVRVFTPCDDATLCERSAQALAAFHQRRWESADAAIDDVLALAPGDRAALRLKERIAAARALPEGAPWSPAIALDKL